MTATRVRRLARRGRRAAALVLGGFAAVGSLALAVPVVGRAASQVLNVVTFAAWTVVGAAADLVAPGGARRIRLEVVVLRGADGEPVAPPAAVESALAETGSLFLRSAGVEVDYRPVTVASGWLASTPRVRTVSCAVRPRDAGAWGDDLGLAGSVFELLATRYGFARGANRLVGLAAPVTVFVVEEVEGALACSLGPLTDYVTVDADAVAADDGVHVVAHELGHACGLGHHRGRDNLMHPTNAGPALTETQVARLRRSARVSRL